MVVLITNLTDAPGKNSTEVDIYNKTLSPGSFIRIPADLVNKNIRDLEERGIIAIGNLPPWYVTAKRRNKPLSKEERQKRLVQPLIEPPVILRLERPEKKDKKDKQPIDIFEEPAAKKG